MIQKFIISLIICVFFLNAPSSFADEKGAYDICNPSVDVCTVADYSCQQSKSKPGTYLCQPSTLGAYDICNPSDPNTHCNKGYSCQESKSKAGTYLCQLTTSGIGNIFGKITAPDAISKLAGKDTTGASGISKFLSNLVQLIYTFAAIALLFMLIWGAFDWIVSEGDKEKLQAAQRKILNAIIGIVLFAVAFAIISILGTFTGFRFFQGQGVKTLDPRSGYKFLCPDGTSVGGGSDNPDTACKGHGT